MNPRISSPLFVLVAFCFLGRLVCAQGGELTIQAFSFDGFPVADAAFTIETDGGTTSVVTTDDTGIWSDSFTSASLPFTITLTDERYVSPVSEHLIDYLPERLSYPLFQSETEKMAADEKLSFTYSWPQFLSRQAIDHFPKDDATTTNVVISDSTMVGPLVISSFFKSTRREEALPPIAPVDEMTSSSIIVRVVDEYGQPMENVLVYLFQFNGSTGNIRLASYERADEAGFAEFTGLAPRMLYRAEAEANGSSTGKSAFALAEPGVLVRIPNMVVRSPSQTIMGAIFEGELPASETVVKVEPQRPGVPGLTVTTDPFGYFTLAPVPAENIWLSFYRMTEDGSRRARMRVEPGSGEVLVPFHILSEPIQ